MIYHITIYIYIHTCRVFLVSVGIIHLSQFVFPTPNPPSKTSPRPPWSQRPCPEILGIILPIKNGSLRAKKPGKPKKKHHVFNGWKWVISNNYFPQDLDSLGIFHCYVSLPEGSGRLKVTLPETSIFALESWCETQTILQFWEGPAHFQGRCRFVEGM